MTRLAALAGLGLVLAACGSSPLTLAQFERETRRICAGAQSGLTRSATTAEVRRAHDGALKRIRALETTDATGKRVAPTIDRLANQGERLEQLERADSRDARPARLAELAAAVELEQRLAGDAAAAKAAAGCLTLSAPLVERYAVLDYARRVPRLLRHGRAVVHDPAWRDLLSDDPALVHDAADHMWKRLSYYGSFGLEWDRLSPPRTFRREHRAVTRAINAMSYAVMDASSELETTGGTLAKARRILRPFAPGRRDFLRASARLLRALERVSD